MHLGKNNPCFTYTLNNTTLKQTSSEKDLGVFVDPLLNFEDHINASVKKAKRMSGLIMHTINYKSKTIMIPLFKSLVRPIIEQAQRRAAAGRSRHKSHGGIPY